MKHLTFYLLLVSVASAFAQPRIEWQRVLGGKGNEDVFDMIATRDSGLLLVGYTTSSKDGDVKGVNNGDKDYWIVKLDNSAKPTIQWEKNFGTEKEEVAFKALQDKETGHFIVIGKTGSETNGNGFDTANNYDYWLLELDEKGDSIRDTIFGSPYVDDYLGYPVNRGLDDFTQIELLQTRDKKYLVFLGDISIKKNQYLHTDAWWLKMDWKTWGLVAEQKLDFDGPERLPFYSLISGLVETKEGFLFCAMSTLLIGELLPKKNEYWLQQVDTSGKASGPAKNFGGSGDEYPRDMIVDSDGNFLVIGESRSSDRDVKEQFPQPGQTSFYSDIWLLKLNKNLDNILWSKCFGAIGDDKGRAVIQALDGGYYLGGFSSDGQGGDICRRGDFIVIKLNREGNIQWTANFGLEGKGVFKMIELNGKLVICGRTNSGNPDLLPNTWHGGNDMWVLQLENLECNSLANPLPRPEIKKTVLGDKVKIEVVNTPFSPPGMQYRWKSMEKDTFTESPWIIVPAGDSNIYNVRFKYRCCFSEPTLTVVTQLVSGRGGSWTITPNGDSRNDTFAPNWLLEGSAFLQVFNLQGQQLFEAQSYNNDWDGTYQGQPLPEGTYLYLVRLKEDGKIYRGTINIRR